MIVKRSLPLLAASCIFAASGWAQPLPETDAAGIEFYEQKIRPLIHANCVACHGPNKQQASLRLDSRAGMLQGGDRGPVIVPGKPERSLLIQAIAYRDDEVQMPPRGKLSQQQIADLTRWIQLGSPAPVESTAAAVGKAEFDFEARRKHWCFQPLQTVPPPRIKREDWPANSTDRYILAKLESAGLAPAPDADKRTLIRRASFALIGLPPTVDEVALFLADNSPDAFVRVVDRLLASPHFGERWGRHWLDLVRFAETKGHEFDYSIPNAYQYRDYVIRAFNADLPYNQFVVEHLAGDLLEVPRLHPEAGFNESILGTGFWFLGEEVHSPVDIHKDQADRSDNKIDVFSKTFLALTVACARCHDHKFDAIPTSDYYALSGFLLSSGYRQARFETMEQHRRVARELSALRESHRGKIVKEVAAANLAAIANLPDALLAAREAIQLSLQGDRSLPEQPINDQQRSQLAERYKLPEELLTTLVAQVKQAKDKPDDPLHVWSVLAHVRGEITAERLRRILDELRTAWQFRQAAAIAAQAQFTVIVDYGNLAPHDWLADGEAFGQGPLRAGEVLLAQDPNRPPVEVVGHASARADAFWNGLTLTPGTEREPGRLSWLQPGRTLKTPTWTLTTGKVYCLVQGSGHAYAAVDAHRMNNGPLHAALIREWDGGLSSHWIEFNLANYRGHRVHLEFTPKEPTAVKAGNSGELAVLRVIEAEQRPNSLAAPNGRLTELLANRQTDSLEALAQAYQRLFQDILRRIGEDAIRTNPDAQLASSDAQLANWLLQQSGKLWSIDEVSQRRISEAASPFAAAQAQLASQVVRSSRTAPALWDGSGVDEFVFIRGNHKSPGELAPRRMLQAIGGQRQPPIQQGSGRLELARRMTDVSNPLLSRVMVNRIWHHLFGRGMVASCDNFGVMGESPTHAELLDHLAGQFVRDGWSIKRLIREIMLSRTYRMSSEVDPASQLAMQVDPRNLLLSRMNVRRLEGEIVRDSMLAVSGRLDRKLFGPSVPIHLTPFMEGRGRPGNSGPLDGDGRRSIYLNVRRNFLSPMFLAFDYPTPFTTIGRRTVSNVPAQALIMMNSPLVIEQAGRWSQRMLAEPGHSREQRIAALYESAFSRAPTSDELQQSLAFLTEQSRLHGNRDEHPQAWADLCHVLFNAKEFMFVP